MLSDFCWRQLVKLINEINNLAVERGTTVSEWLFHGNEAGAFVRHVCSAVFSI